jgi:hypothetical protein
MLNKGSFMDPLYAYKSFNILCLVTKISSSHLRDVINNFILLICSCSDQVKV